MSDYEIGLHHHVRMKLYYLSNPVSCMKRESFVIAPAFHKC